MQHIKKSLMLFLVKHLDVALHTGGLWGVDIRVYVRKLQLPRSRLVRSIYYHHGNRVKHIL